MKTQDEALAISNPRLLSAVYFGLLSIIATIALDTALYALGVEKLLPIAKATFLAVVVAACFGALFGKRIVLSRKPYYQHVFLWAFIMVLSGLPVYSMGFLYFLKDMHADWFTPVTLTHLVFLYLLVLAYGFILVGVWLAVIAGFAAMYLRGYLVYYILQSQYQQHKNPAEGKTTPTRVKKGKHHK